MRQFDSKATRDLVAHAGIAILKVIANWLDSPPQLVQLAGETAGCANDHISWAGMPIHGTQDLRIRGQLVADRGGSDAINRFLPSSFARSGIFDPTGGNTPTRKCDRE